MLAYFLLIGIPLVFSTVVIGNKQDKKGKAFVMASFFLVYFLLLALRADTVGVDLENYLPHFKEYYSKQWNSLFVDDETEAGYLFLNKFIGTIWADNQFFLTCIALICVFPLAILYCKESEKPLVSMATFLILPVFTMLFSGLRQGIAIAMVAPAYYFTKKKKLMGFILTVLFAMLFHTSAFVVALLYPVYHANITKEKLFFVVPVILLVLVFNKQVFEFVLRLLGDEFYEEYYSIQETDAYTMLIMFVIFTVYAFITPQKDKLDKDTVGLRNILLLSLCLQTFAPINQIAMRMNYYFIVFLPLLIPKIGARCHTKDKDLVKLLEFLLIVFFIVYFIWTGYTGADILQVFPYTPFWE